MKNHIYMHINVVHFTCLFHNSFIYFDYIISYEALILQEAVSKTEFLYHFREKF